MRTRGWNGDIPASDAEAVARILAATRESIDERGEQTSLADVARRLGVTRQTIYHYFADTNELLGATAAEAAAPFLEHLTQSLRGITDPGDAVVEGIALTLERLPADPYVGVMLRMHRSAQFATIVISDTARLFGRVLLERLDVDWSVFTAEALDTILHLVLRTLQSLILTPLDQSGESLRAFLRAWIAPAISAAPRH